MLEKVSKRIRRHTRIRAKISGSAIKPRLAVYRSNTAIYAQFIDDISGKTLCSASDLKLKSGTKVEKAAKVWEEIGKKAQALWITTCVFDRGWFMYIWRVKALADEARKTGLQF
ncbi:MAG: 50S ribosomal protein L18 [uncultured bacterium (gcode 4)]|uniref:Large ribosomal subunit protein uL18 n=1 Tax=uncultured bacterium (gcode 4) TaxID=1234023 RepID=K2FVR3_9BACT|nr:MAG: 50S ribosomal protein L18 [uncultured bacterium (gcode 4)]